MNTRLIAVAVPALVALVAVIVFALRDTVPPGMPKPRAPVSAPRPAAGQAGSAPSRSTDGAPPPWAAASASLPMAAAVPGTSNAPVDGAATPGNGVSKDTERDLKELQGLQAELTASMQDGKQPDSKKIAAVLNKVKEMRGPVVGGVNLDAVLNNLEKAGEIQTLAQAMQREAAKPGGGDRKLLAAQVEQLKKLQAQLRNDVSVAAAPAAGTKK